MAKFHSLKARFIIRDNRTPCIIYRNKKWSLNITLNNPNEFNINEGKLTSHYRGTDKDEINKTIQKRYQLINRLITEGIEQGVDTLEYIKKKLEEEESRLRKLNVDANTKISDAFFDYMTSKGYNKNIEAGRTYDRYKSQLSRLRDFEKGNKKKLGKLNIEWAKEYALFLATPFNKTYEVIDKKNERKFSSTKTLSSGNSTITRYLIDIVAMCKYIMKDKKREVDFDIEEIKDYINSFDLPTSDTENIIVLSSKQLADYRNYKPREGHEYEIKTYDLFLFCLNTGLRYSDATKLTDNYIRTDEKGNEVITMNAQKTRGQFTVPMNLEAQNIFNKYNRDFRKKFPTNQQINKNLRKLVKRIPSFCELVIVKKYILKKITQTKTEYYNALSFHDSRKTYVSRIIAVSPPNGIIAKIMRLTGWVDLRSLNKYLSIFSKENSVSDLETLELI